MEKFTLLLIIAIIAGFILICTLVLAFYIILCEYYELKFHYLTPKKSGMVNKSSGYSSSTIVPSTIISGTGGGSDSSTNRGRPTNQGRRGGAGEVGRGGGGR